LYRRLEWTKNPDLIRVCGAGLQTGLQSSLPQLSPGTGSCISSKRNPRASVVSPFLLPRFQLRNIGGYCLSGYQNSLLHYINKTVILWQLLRNFLSFLPATAAPFPGKIKALGDPPDPESFCLQRVLPSLWRIFLQAGGGIKNVTDARQIG